MTLFFYVLRLFFKFVSATVMLSLFLFILFDFIHKTTSYFAKFEPEAKYILQFYATQLPFQVLQVLPIASLLASVIVMVLLNRGNEVTAMRAAGMSPMRIAAPLAFGGLCISLFTFLVSEFLVPISAQKMHYIKKVHIEKQGSFYEQKHEHWVRNGNQILYFKTFNPIAKTIEMLKLIHIDEKFRPVKSIHSKTAYYQPSYDYWLLKNPETIYFAEDGSIEHTKQVDEMTMFLPLEPDNLQVELRLPDEMSIRELGEEIERGQKYGYDVLGQVISWHVKWAYTFAAFVISLIGIQFGYKSERTTETVRSMILAFAFGISYWFILSASRALASAGSLPPMLAAWLANIIILSIIVLQIWRISNV